MNEENVIKANLANIPCPIGGGINQNECIEMVSKNPDDCLKADCPLVKNQSLRTLGEDSDVDCRLYKDQHLPVQACLLTQNNDICKNCSADSRICIKCGSLKLNDTKFDIATGLCSSCSASSVDHNDQSDVKSDGNVKAAEMLGEGIVKMIEQLLPHNTLPLLEPSELRRLTGIADITTVEAFLSAGDATIKNALPNPGQQQKAITLRDALKEAQKSAKPLDVKPDEQVPEDSVDTADSAEDDTKLRTDVEAAKVLSVSGSPVKTESSVTTDNKPKKNSFEGSIPWEGIHYPVRVHLERLAIKTPEQLSKYSRLQLLERGFTTDTVYWLRTRFLFSHGLQMAPDNDQAVIEDVTSETPEQILKRLIAEALAPIQTAITVLADSIPKPATPQTVPTDSQTPSIKVTVEIGNLPLDKLASIAPVLATLIPTPPPEESKK